MKRCTMIALVMLLFLCTCVACGTQEDKQEDTQEANIVGILPLPENASIKKLPKDGILQMEEGNLSITQITNKRGGYTGTGYITQLGDKTAFAEVQCNIEERSYYKIIIRYATDGNKFNSVFINGDLYGAMQFASAPEFIEYDTGRVLLNKGLYSFKIGHEWGNVDIDYIKLEKAEAPLFPKPKKELINKNATQETKALMSFLVDNFGKKILSGVQSDILQLMRRTDNKLAAVRGFDLLSYCPINAWGDGTTMSAIEWYNLKNGLVAMSWHWFAPVKDENNQASFYTNKTSFDVSKAVTEGTEENKLIIRDIDAIAEELKLLELSKVPVLWRPLHEADGGWFWWSAKGPEAYLKLYHILYDRLVNHHQLNNLIWVWNAVDPAWYPGNESVDIVSCDIYPPNNNYGACQFSFQNLVNLSKGEKIVALAENGSCPDPDQMIQSNTPWSWFSIWAGEFVSDPKYTEDAQMIKLFGHEEVLTLEELPDLKSYPVD